ncbi:MAG TPA: VanZ family protein [Puia sp.]|nr:VanZ family protein [Puia sp.]
MLNFLRKYFSSLYIPLLWTAIVGTLCCLPGSMIPSESRFGIPQFDKFVHVTFFGGFVFLWNLYASRRVSDEGRLLRLFFLWYVIGNIYGIGTEYIQKYWIPGRDYDQADIIADMIGAGLAYGLSNLWLISASAKATADEPADEPADKSADEPARKKK